MSNYKKGSGKSESVGTVYIRESKSGMKYLALTIGEKKYVVFKNDRKTEENQPDYRVYDAAPKTGGQDSSGGGYKPKAAPGTSRPAPAKAQAAPVSEEATAEDNSDWLPV